MKVVKCDRCKEEIPENPRDGRVYNVVYTSAYMDLCDNCYCKLVRFINNTDTLSKVKSLIDNWAVDDDEHVLLGRIANIVNEEEEDE